MNINFELSTVIIPQIIGKRGQKRPYDIHKTLLKCNNQIWGYDNVMDEHYFAHPDSYNEIAIRSVTEAAAVYLQKELSDHDIKCCVE